MEKVFITGRGLVTPLGNGLAVNEAALRAGKSGISVVPEFVEKSLTSIVGGVPDHDPVCELIDRKTKRFSPPAAVMSVVAAAEAFAEAGIPVDKVSEYPMALIGGQVLRKPFA